MFNMLSSLLITAILFIANGCNTKMVDSGIPHMYILNLDFRLDDTYPLNDLNLDEIKSSITSDIKDQKAKLNIELFSVDEKHYLRLITSVVPALTSDEISYSIRNKRLFGDDQQHPITVQWIKENNKSKILKTTVDGITLKAEKDRGFVYFTVTN